MRLTKSYNKVRTMRRWLMAVMLFLVLVPTSAKVRIMLISDPHVMGPGLLIKEGSAWDNTIYYDRKLNDYSRAIFDELIAIALQEKPDLFLITGDLTKDGELLSHEHVASKLQLLKEAGIQPFVIPGNHDLGTNNALYFDGDHSYKAETIDAQQFAEIYKDFGYGDDVAREPTSLTWCYEPVDGLVLIGIDTGQDGTLLNGVISETTLDWVCERAATATKAGKQIIVMMHHALFPHVTNADKLSSTYVVKYGVKINEGAYVYHSYSWVRDRLSEAGVGVVLSGHVHVSDIAKDAYDNLTRTVHDISTASCAAHPNPYRLLTLNDDRATMGIQTRYVTELPGVDDFPAMAEQRMTQGLVDLVSMSTYNSEVSNLFTEIFKVHVAGNEAENPRQQEFLQMYEDYLPQLQKDVMVKAYLIIYNVTFDDLTCMVHSMLEDKSNYGDADRESLDDDLNTTIPVSGDGWTGMEPVARKQEPADRSQWFTLQGVRIAKPEQKGIYIHKDNDGTKFIYKH